MLSLSDIYNSIIKRVLTLAGGTMNNDAIITFQSQQAEKIRLHASSGYSLGVQSNELSLIIPPAAEVKIRDSTPTGTIRGTVYHSGNDGAGSGLDADLLDGANSSESAAASTIVLRDSVGDVYSRALRSTIANSSTAIGSTSTLCFRNNNLGDPINRYADRDKVVAWLQSGGIGALNVAEYAGSCSGGTQTNVTITAVTAGSAYIVPTWFGDQSGAGAGVVGYERSSTTQVVVRHPAGYTGFYRFQVVS